MPASQGALRAHCVLHAARRQRAVRHRLSAVATPDPRDPSEARALCAREAVVRSGLAVLTGLRAALTCSSRVLACRAVVASSVPSRNLVLACPGSFACTLCPALSTSPAGSIDITSCMCNTGYSGTAGSCTQCPANTYKATTGSVACSFCQNNSTSALASTTQSS
jgi:hypothetical protein